MNPFTGQSLLKRILSIANPLWFESCQKLIPSKMNLFRKQPFKPHSRALERCSGLLPGALLGANFAPTCVPGEQKSAKRKEKMRPNLKNFALCALN